MSTAPGDPLGRDAAATGAITALAISNVMTNRVLPGRAYVAWNLAVAAGLVALGRRAGLTDDELGLDRRSLPGAMRLGASGAVVVAGTYAVLAAGEGHAVLVDRRAARAGPGEAAWQCLVRIPLGTVVLEEVAFRGVLPALLDHEGRRPWVAAAASAALFGVWHLLPSGDLADANDAVSGAAGRGGTPLLRAGAVVVTAAAGGLLQGLRHRGGHVVAPAMVHLATNVLGYLAARHVQRGGRGDTGEG